MPPPANIDTDSTVTTLTAVPTGTFTSLPTLTVTNTFTAVPTATVRPLRRLHGHLRLLIKLLLSLSRQRLNRPRGLDYINTDSLGDGTPIIGIRRHHIGFIGQRHPFLMCRRHGTVDSLYLSDEKRGNTYRFGLLILRKPQALRNQP